LAGISKVEWSAPAPAGLQSDGELFTGQAMLKVAGCFECRRYNDLRGEVADEEEVRAYGGHRAVQGTGAISSLEGWLGIKNIGVYECLSAAQQAAVVGPGPQSNDLADAAVAQYTR